MEIFIKKNNTPFKDSLLKEKAGLELLSKSLENNPDLHTPRIFDVNEENLKLEKIDSPVFSKKLSKNLGIGLASLHKKIYPDYGLGYHNYIGLNPQKNTLSKNWGEFFIKYRVLYQIKLIQNPSVQKHFNNIIHNNSKKLNEFLTTTTKHPSLIHGDLWSGNVLFGKDKVYLIDPAVYFADREVDIAMSEMFGGFDKEFYRAYNETYPLSSAYETKKVIYNLYHYLNHYNLFGSSYLDGCENGFTTIKNL